MVVYEDGPCLKVKMFVYILIIKAYFNILK